MNILVVDDNPLAGRSIQKLLSLKHKSVEFTQSGKEAFTRISKFWYDLIISDINMPGVSGPSLYEKVKIMNPDQAEKMVFITGGVSTRDDQVFLSKMKDRFALKPINETKLSLLIRGLQERSSQKLSGGLAQR